MVKQREFALSNDLGANYHTVLTNDYHIDGQNRVDGLSQTAAGATALWAGATLPDSKSIALEYNFSSQRTGLRRYNTAALSNGSWTFDTNDLIGQSTYEYHYDGRLKELIHGDSFDPSPFATYETTFNDDGRLEKKITKLRRVNHPDFGLAQEFRYDAQGQLKSVGVALPDTPNDLTWSDVSTHEHDAHGNELGKDDAVGYANRAYTFAGIDYQYDDLGNVTFSKDTEQGDERTLTWDHRNHLVSVANALNDRGTVEYHYDVLGRKVARKHVDATPNPTTTQTSYVYEGQSIALEVDAVSEDITRSYFNGPGTNEVLAIDQYMPTEGTETVWLFADMVGTVRTIGRLNDTTELWDWAHRNFDEFGDALPFRYLDGGELVTTSNGYVASSSNTITPDAFLASAPTIWAGHQLDEASDLYDMKARWYDPTSHRFLTEDPDRTDINLYRYGAGDPVNNIDPDGRSAVGIGIGIVAIGASYYSASQHNAAGELIGRVDLTAIEQAQLYALQGSAGRFQIAGEVLATISLAVTAAPLAAPLYGGVASGVATLGGGTGLQLAAGATVVGVTEKVGLDALTYASGVDTHAFRRYSSSVGFTALDFGVSIATAGLFNGADDVARLLARGARGSVRNNAFRALARSGLVDGVGYGALAVGRAPARGLSIAERQALVAARTPEEVASRLARANDLRRVRDGIPSRLFHFTDEAGEAGIVGSQQLRPSLRAVNPKDARFGDGQYLTDIAPGTRTPAQLSRAFIGQPFQGRRFTNFVEVDVSGLRVIRGREGVFVIRNSEPLDLSGRIIRSGGN